MKKIILTGGSGFIGQVVYKLLKKEYEIITLNLSSDQDITNPKTFEKLEADYVIHLAGSPKENGDAIIKANVIGTKNVLDFCKRTDAKMIYSSTCGVYAPSEKPMNENSELKLGSINAISKRAGELLCKHYSEAGLKNIVILRLFNVYGPGQKEGFIIPDIMKQIRNEKIFLKNPYPKRDLIYVDDVAEAIKKSLGVSGTHIVNIGSGESYSVEEIAKKIIQGKEIVFSNKIQINDNFCADITKAKQFLGWQPKTKLDEGLKKTQQFNRL